MKALAAALLIALGAPAAALAQTERVVTVVVPPPVHPAPRDGDAMALITLLLPETQVPLLVAAGFRQGLAKARASNPKASGPYDAYPGMEAFVVDRLSKTLDQLALADLPNLREQLAMVLRADMNPQEIADALAFFQSPTGKRMQARVAEAIQGETPTTAEARQKRAVQAATEGLTPDDYPALRAFGASSAARKMQQVNPKIIAASQAWGQQFGAANAAKLTAAREAAEAEFLAKKK